MLAVATKQPACLRKSRLRMAPLSAAMMPARARSEQRSKRACRQRFDRSVAGSHPRLLRARAAPRPCRARAPSAPARRARLRAAALLARRSECRRGNHQRRNRSDPERAGQVLLGIDVDFAPDDVGVAPGRLLVDRGERPARAAPRRPEIDEHDAVLVHVVAKLPAFNSVVCMNSSFRAIRASGPSHDTATRRRLPCHECMLRAMEPPRTYFRLCSSCKKELPFASAYYVCSVSTCNRKRTGLTFCSLPCFEAHVPIVRHREAWAEELRAPSAESMRASWPRSMKPRALRANRARPRRRRRSAAWCPRMRDPAGFAEHARPPARRPDRRLEIEGVRPRAFRHEHLGRSDGRAQ